MARKAVKAEEPLVCEAPVQQAPVQEDPFKRLGTTTVDGVTTASYAAAIAGGVTLKTVTTKDGNQSEALLFFQGFGIAPTSVDGFYKVVSI